MIITRIDGEEERYTGTEFADLITTDDEDTLLSYQEKYYGARLDTVASVNDVFASNYGDLDAGSLFLDNGVVVTYTKEQSDFAESLKAGDTVKVSGYIFDVMSSNQYEGHDAIMLSNNDKPHEFFINDFTLEPQTASIEKVG